MSKIIKEYWEFKENQYLRPYKLGQEIDFEKEHLNLKKINDNEYEYIGIENYLWVLTIENNIVLKICYKNNFPLPNIEFWNNDYNFISNELKRKTNQIDINYNKDKMFIIYRDYFVSVIILIKGTEPQLHEE